jgi:hypothetical protein
VVRIVRDTHAVFLGPFDGITLCKLTFQCGSIYRATRHGGYREIRGTTILRGRLTSDAAAPERFEWQTVERQDINFDMDGKDERFRRHLYSFTRTKYPGHSSVYLGVAQVFDW